MSLTESSGVFAAVHESSINDLVTAICTTRPHLLSYGSPAFVPVSTVDERQMPAIAFPGSGGIQWRVSFKIPELDLYDQDVPLAPELTLEKQQFSLSTRVRLCVDCPKEPRGEKDPREEREEREQREREERERREREEKEWRERDPRERDPRDPREEYEPRDERPVSKAENPVCTSLSLQAVGHLVDTWTAGERAIGFAVDAVEIVDIAPDHLETVLECLMAQMLRAALAQIRLPLSAINAGAFTLTPTEGPVIELDRVLARGTL